MKTTTAALIVLMQASLAWAGPDLIEMAKTENNFSLELLTALNHLPRKDLNAARDEEGRSMLHWLAIRSHQARALPVLLAGGDVNATDHRGRTPIFDVLEANDVAHKGSADMMFLEMLTLRGADVNARASDGTSPLAVAVTRGDYEKAEFLLRHGAIPNPEGLAAEKTPLAIAQSKDDKRMFALLQEAMKTRSVEVEKALPSPPEGDQVAKALTAADLKALDRFVKAGWDVNERNEKGQTPLLRAVEACRPDLVTDLIFKGADPNIADANGKTPLMASMRFLGIDGQRMTAMLLLKGANVEATTKDGQTALTAAAAAGHDYGVMWLIAAGADPLARTPKGPLIEYANHPPTAWLLKRFGSPDRKPEVEDTTPNGRLFSAIRKGSLDETEAALKDGASASAVDKSGPALSWAAMCGRFEIVDLLITNGADINQQFPNTGWHVLHDLASWGPAQGNPDVAAEHIEKLLKLGANPDIQSKDGTTPLMVAAKAGLKGANTQALVKGGASLTIRNKEGLTVLGVARKYGRTEMVEYLQSLGAKD